MDSTRFPNMRLNEAIISKTPPEVLELLLRLSEENQALGISIQTLQREILTIKAQIERLENLLARNSSNST